jgi:hypothetical protein
MTSTAALASHSADQLRAGMEFSPGEVAGFLTLLALLVLGGAVLLAAFVTALVNSAQQLHRAGRLRHPGAAVAVPIAALFVAYLTRSTPASLVLAAAAVAFGYTIMWRSGQGWFRWTAVPALLWTLALVSIR